MSYFFYVPVAQLDRVSDSDSEGRAFESHRAYHTCGEHFALRRFSFYYTFFAHVVDLLFNKSPLFLR